LITHLRVRTAKTRNRIKPKPHHTYKKPNRRRSGSQGWKSRPNRIISQRKRLSQAVSKAFEWARQNVNKFDDSKSEMIHFELKKEMSLNTIILSNETTLKPRKSVKWLGIYIDKKLNFKKHVNKKVVNATKALHLINRLQNIEWELSSTTSRQLYMTCTSVISDYDSEIW
jgi:hypothetical protein